MSRRDAQVAARILERVPGVPARFGFGTAQSLTDADGDTLILPDGIPEVTAAVDEEELESGVEIEPDPNQPNQPVPALTVCGPVAAGERVAWVSLPSGPLLVVGSLGAQWRLIGAALVAGGRTNQTVTSTSETDLTDLSCEVEVAHPGHLVVVQAQLVVRPSANASLVGRIQRTEETDEGDSSTSEVGRYFRHSSAVSGVDYGMTTPVVDTPDPGAYTYKATMQSSATGFVIVTAPTGTTPLYAAALLVWDAGPLPEGTTTA